MPAVPYFTKGFIVSWSATVFEKVKSSVDQSKTFVCSHIISTITGSTQSTVTIIERREKKGKKSIYCWD